MAISSINKEAAAKFRSLFKNKNFMTPKIIKIDYLMSDSNIIYELSEGTGIGGNPIYGVTVMQDGQHAREKSQMFHSLMVAKDYVKNLR